VARKAITQERRVLTDFPDVIPIREEELALWETYLRDIINEMINSNEL